MRTVFLRAVGILAVALLLQMVMTVSTGLRPDYVFMALITFSAMLTFGELTLLTAGSALLLASRPDGGIAVLALVAIPLLFFAVRRFVPWQAWFTNVLLLLLASVLFLLVTIPRVFYLAPVAASILVIIDICIGMFIYGIMQQKASRRRSAL